MSPHHKSSRRVTSAGGRPRSRNARSVRLSLTCLDCDSRDLEALSAAWGVPMSTLLWGIVHDYLQRARGVSSDLGDMRGALRMMLEMALRDEELGPWLRQQIGATPQG